MINCAERFYVQPEPALRPVGAIVDGVLYETLAGWCWSEKHGVVSRGNYLGSDGDAVWIDGIKYYKVVLPTDRQIKVLHPDFHLKFSEMGDYLFNTGNVRDDDFEGITRHLDLCKQCNRVVHNMVSEDHNDY
jgi:hypothetical protein